jgi:hypothetical protein
VPVELRLLGASPEQVELFADEPAGGALDVLRRPDGPRFVPVVGPAGPFLVSRAQILWIALAPASSAEPADELDLHSLRGQLVVDLIDGAHLEGEVLYTAPEGRGRIGDFLNGADPFFPLWIAGRLHFVAKAHVVRIRER